MATTAMEQGRINKVLNTKMNFGEGFGILTRREWLDNCFNAGNYFSESYLGHPFEYSRTKHNLMDNDEQKVYEGKWNSLTLQYKIQKKGSNILTPVTKIEFDYFNSLSATQP